MSQINNMNEPRYENLWGIIAGYFHEDFDLFGGNVEEIIETYKNGTDIATRQAAIHDIDKFKHDCSANLDFALKREFGTQFDPKLWGYTTDSFLNELKRLLQE